MRWTTIKRGCRPLAVPALIAAVCLGLAWSLYIHTSAGTAQEQEPFLRSFRAAVHEEGLEGVAGHGQGDVATRRSTAPDSFTLRSKRLVLVLGRGGDGSGLGFRSIRNTGADLALTPVLTPQHPLFEIEFTDGVTITSHDFVELEAQQPSSSSVSISMVSQQLSVQARFKADMHPTLGFVRMALTLTSMAAPIPVRVRASACGAHTDCALDS